MIEFLFLEIEYKFENFRNCYEKKQFVKILSNHNSQQHRRIVAEL